MAKPRSVRAKESNSQQREYKSRIADEVMDISFNADIPPGFFGRYPFLLEAEILIAEHGKIAITYHRDNDRAYTGEDLYMQYFVVEEKQYRTKTDEYGVGFINTFRRFEVPFFNRRKRGAQPFCRYGSGTATGCPGTGIPILW